MSELVTDANQPVVYVVDDDASIRAALADMLESISLKVRIFETIKEFLQSEIEDVPSCLVLDIRMPEMSGLEFQRKMPDLNLQIPLIFITAHGDIPMCVQAMKAGAVDFLTKPFRDQALIDAIHIGIEQDRKRRRSIGALTALQKSFRSLTAGEQDVLLLMSRGYLSKQIADQLGVSEITVKVRRRQIKQKMNAYSTAELARIVERLGIDTV